jgi:hypothetical protein
MNIATLKRQKACPELLHRVVEKCTDYNHFNIINIKIQSGYCFK